MNIISIIILICILIHAVACGAKYLSDTFGTPDDK